MKRPFPFEQWYMFYFNDVHLWERRHSSSLNKPPSYTQLICPMGGLAKSSLFSMTMHEMLNPDAQVLEIAGKLTDLAKV